MGCMGDSVECPTSAQVMISRFLSLRPVWRFVLTAQSLDPASNSVSPFLSSLYCAPFCQQVPFLFRIDRTIRKNYHCFHSSHFLSLHCGHRPLLT